MASRSALVFDSVFILVQCGPTIPGSKKIRKIFEIYSCELHRLDTLLSLCQSAPEFLPSSIFISSIFFVIGGPEVELSKNAYELKMYKGLSFHL